MKKSRFYLTAFFLAITLNLFFNGCKKDDSGPIDGQPLDVTIPINDSSSFNMKNFITSLEQLFLTEEIWSMSYTHEYVEGLARVSYMNFDHLDIFGEKVYTMTHIYDQQGIITKSGLSGNLIPGRIYEITWGFDKDGFINRETQSVNGSVVADVVLEYNNKHQLTKKIFKPLSPDGEERTESFQYNPDGTVAFYDQGDGITYELNYNNGFLIQQITHSELSGDDSTSYEYDNQGRFYRTLWDGYNRFMEAEYKQDVMFFNTYFGDKLTYKQEIGPGLMDVRYYRYLYDDNDVFDFCKVEEFDEYGWTLKKYYGTGLIDDLQYIGYSVIDSRDPSDLSDKTKESVYDISGTQLYYVEFVYDNGFYQGMNWYKPDGTPVEEADITEAWVPKLVNDFLWYKSADRDMPVPSGILPLMVASSH